MTKIFMAFFNFLGFSIFLISVFYLTHVRSGVCEASPLQFSILEITDCFLFKYYNSTSTFAWRLDKVLAIFIELIC